MNSWLLCIKEAVEVVIRHCSPRLFHLFFANVLLDASGEVHKYVAQDFLTPFFTWMAFAPWWWLSFPESQKLQPGQFFGPRCRELCTPGLCLQCSHFGSGFLPWFLMWAGKICGLLQGLQVWTCVLFTANGLVGCQQKVQDQALSYRAWDQTFSSLVLGISTSWVIIKCR